ncbi:hypothetical protein LPJ59_004809, partial [Coemansia sp. RSA 2399]
MRVPFSERGVRDSTAIPTMTCAQCSKEVHIRLIGEHQCLGRPDVPEMPPGMNSRQLSSFFDAPEPTSRPPVSRYNNPHDPMDARKAVESRMFPAAYKPSMQLLSEDAGGDEFDFDEMLNNASSFRPGAMSNESLEEVISPGPRKVPVFNNSNSSLSLDGLSPYDALASARRDMGEQLSARSNGSEFGFKSEPRPKNNMATLQNSLMQNMRPNAVGLPATQPPESPQAQDSPTEPPILSSSSSSAFSLSTVSSPVKPTTMARTNSTADQSKPPSQQQQQQPKSSEGEGAGGMAKSGDTSHHHRDHQQKQQQQQQHGEENGEGKRKQQEQPAQHKSTLPPDKGRYLHRKTSSNARGPETATPVSATVSSAITAGPNKGENSRGHDNGSSLSIGSMMKAQTTKTRRGGDAANGSIVRRQQQGSSPTSPTSPTQMASNEGGSPLRQQAVGAHSPVATDNQIRISAKRPQLGHSGSLQEQSGFSSPLHESHSYTSDTSNLSSSLRAKEEQQRKLTRNATAPASMNGSSSGLLRAPVDGGKGRSTNPFDVLASLVQPSSGMALGKTPGLVASIPPHINTQVSGRLGAGGHSHMRKPSGPRSAGSGGPKSHKTAKLDSLLDDLMGEMQALNIEVRSESDRDSMVSTASLSNSMSSPYEIARDHALRGRFDSTVSTSSTSSTLSTGGGGMHKPRQVHCVTCGVGISVGKNAILRSSEVRNASEIPAAVQGIEHQSRLYCVRDYRRHLATSSRCQGCGKHCDPPPSKDTVNALDAWWHRACFNCQECHKPFPDKSFYVLENRPYCRYDYHRLNKSLCVACSEPIEGPCAQVLEGRFHPGCFACYQCGEALRDVYYSLDGFFLCENH